METKVQKIGGKSPNNKVVGVACGTNGEVKTQRVWENNTVAIVSNAEIRDTNVVSYIVDLSEYAFGTLLFENKLKDSNNNYVDINVQFTDNQTIWLQNFDGEWINTTIKGQVGMTVITPDDVACLKYFDILKLRVVAKSTPASGTLSIVAKLKR